MRKAMLPSAVFRHVVFPGEARRRRLSIDLAAGAGLPSLSHEPEARLSEAGGSFLQWLFARAGLELRAYRAETLERRLPACLRVLGARSPAHARRLLEQEPNSIPAAVSAMLVGVTSFFRDPPVFAQLRDEVVPLLAGPRSGLNVWSVGCSDGAELYSLALLLSELDLLNGSYLLGTDCRPDAIARAREGCYEADALKNLPPELLSRYFVRRTGGWQVVAPMRSTVRWRSADVLQAREPGVWDLILCRNTTMYMRSDAAGRLWAYFDQALRPGGVLVLGKAERPFGVRRFALLGPCIYRRTRG